MSARVLVLGGTAEARALAAALHERGLQVESSLAGRVANPRLPVGEVRIGGFGGVPGLVAYLRQHSPGLVIDATHPFARQISAHAALACRQVGVPVLRLLRPGWQRHPLAASWHWVDDYPNALATAETLGARPFLTTGRQTLPYFGAWADRPVLVRVVEPLADPPPAWTVVLDRGPYGEAGERRLLREHRVDVLLTKDSGGSYTQAKLAAAAAAGVPVVVVRRPPAETGVPTFDSVAELLAGTAMAALIGDASRAS